MESITKTNTEVFSNAITYSLGVKDYILCFAEELFRRKIHQPDTLHRYLLKLAKNYGYFCIDIKFGFEHFVIVILFFVAH